MKKNEFKKILFKVAFCAMACDGDIDQREIDELKVMDKNTSYFESIDLSDELKQLVDDFKTNGAKVIEELFSLLRETKLNPIQELVVLEVALRIISADKRFDENEIKFLNFMRSKLELHDETIIDRFGSLDILYTNEYSKNIEISTSESDFTDSIVLPEMVDLDKLNLKIDKTEEK